MDGSWKTVAEKISSESSENLGFIFFTVWIGYKMIISMSTAKDEKDPSLPLLLFFLC